GRMIQSQMSNLVIRVVPCPLRIADATSDRVGACGAKLLNGFNEIPVAGRPTASLPVRAQSTRAFGPRQARKFLPRKGSPAGDWPLLSRLKRWWGHPAARAPVAWRSARVAPRVF